MSVNPYESSKAADQAPELRPVQFMPRLSTWLIAGGVIVVAVVLLLPNVRYAPEAARRSQCSNNLKQIGLALQNYHDTFGCFPPAYTVDAEGNPLHSWRTLILPFAEQKPLYDNIDFSKPWDDPANKAILETKIHFYVCPSNNLPPYRTAYLAVVAPGSCLQPNQPRTVSEITDGTHSTIMVIEVTAENAVPWMSPQDAGEQLVLSSLTAMKGTPHPNGAQAVFVDGYVQLITRQTKIETLRALISIAGGEDLGDF